MGSALTPGSRSPELSKADASHGGSVSLINNHLPVPFAEVAQKMLWAAGFRCGDRSVARAGGAATAVDDNYRVSSKGLRLSAPIDHCAAPFTKIT